MPVDGSPGGLIALQLADRLAAVTTASIDIVQIAVPVPMATYAAPNDPAGAGYYDPAWDDDALAAARMYVAVACERLQRSGRVVAGEARVAGSVAEGTAGAAQARETDLVVISTHALTGPARTLLGSVADAVVRTSPCPVVLVKRDPED